MNRAERRRLAKEKRKGEAVLQVKRSDLEYLHDEALKSVARTMLPMTILVSIMALRDGEGWGSKRLKRFADRVLETYDAVQTRHITFDDIADAIERETGIVLSERADGFHADTDGRKAG